jgi:hypothetical protein
MTRRIINMDCMLYISGALVVLGIIVIFVGVGFKHGYNTAEAEFKKEDK